MGTPITGAEVYVMAQHSGDLIAREARGAGLDARSMPTLESLERRRLQLWALVVFVLCAVAVVAVVASLGSGDDATRWVSPSSLRFTIVAMVLGVSAYAAEKEIHLRRLEAMLLDERVRADTLGRRLEEHAALVSAQKAVNSVLDLDEVLDLILTSVLVLLRAGNGSVMLVESGDLLRVAAASGGRHLPDERIRLGQSIAGRVAKTRQPLLVEGTVADDEFPGHRPRSQPVESALCVPLLHRGELLGVLNVNGASGGTFEDYDLQLLTLFAETAAVAIANARLFAGEQAHVAELLELDRLKSEFVASVSHELRTPLTSVTNSVAAMRRTLDDDAREQLLDVVERQARRLALMVEEMLESARLDRPGAMPLLRPVDVAALVRLVALEWQLAGQPVSVDAPEHCEVRADPEALRRILGNLIENAHKHGAEPVVVEVEPRSGDAVVSVVDHGPGIPESDRLRVFDRFHRLDASRDRPGVGLGLAIVRGLVTACGGTVWVEDAPNGGAAFRVALAGRMERTQDALVLTEEYRQCQVAGPES